MPLQLMQIQSCSSLSYHSITPQCVGYLRFLFLYFHMTIVKRNISIVCLFFNH